MKKKTTTNDAYYLIDWSPLYKYDKYDVTRILPEISGIFGLFTLDGPRYNCLIFYSCWRDGLRVGLKNFLDPLMTKSKKIITDLDYDLLYYKYTVIDNDIQDMQDILFWLIQEYNPPYNDPEFQDSRRYKNIYLKENVINKES